MVMMWLGSSLSVDVYFLLLKRHKLRIKTRLPVEMWGLIGAQVLIAIVYFQWLWKNSFNLLKALSISISLLKLAFLFYKSSWNSPASWCVLVSLWNLITALLLVKNKANEQKKILSFIKEICFKWHVQNICNSKMLQKQLFIKKKCTNTAPNTASIPVHLSGKSSQHQETIQSCFLRNYSFENMNLWISKSVFCQSQPVASLWLLRIKLFNKSVSV